MNFKETPITLIINGCCSALGNLVQLIIIYLQIMFGQNTWDTNNCPQSISDKSGWSKRTKAWCKELEKDKKWEDYSIRNGDCSKCGFKFYYRTSYYSMRSSSDVTNYNICANADCKEKWEDFS